jgi:hypothetical protein
MMIQKKWKNMGAPRGNKNSSKKLKFPEECQKAYRSYCEWISDGKSHESWNYLSEKMTLTYKTMEKFIRENPIDFPVIHKEIAMTKSLEVWEARGLSMMLGQIEKCQPAIFQMFMRNKFGWDKEDRKSSQESQTLLHTLLDIWKNSAE